MIVGQKGTKTYSIFLYLCLCALAAIRKYGYTMMRLKLTHARYVLSGLWIFSLYFMSIPSFAAQESEAPGVELARQTVKAQHSRPFPV
jgi:hypothetical protein